MADDIVGNASVAHVDAGTLARYGGSIGVGGIGSAILSGGASFLVQAGLSLALGAVSELFHRKPRLLRRKEIQRNLADPGTYLPVVYGAQQVGINRVFVASNGPSGNPQGFLWVIGAICHGPIAGIDEIYVDGKLAVTAAGNAQWDANAANDFSEFVTAWKAYGTEGQLMYHPRSSPRTVTGNGWNDTQSRYVDFSSAHSYVAGDTLYFSGMTGSGITDGAYYVKASPPPTSTRVYIGYASGGVSVNYSGLSGACDYYNPDLPAELGANWPAKARGAGVAYIILRFAYNELRFPNGIPAITANVRGMTMTDPRSAVTGSISSSATSSGIPRHTAAVVVTTSAAHGLSAGDTVTLSGHTAASGINGTHRIYDVPSSTTFRIPVAYKAAGSGGTWTKRSYSTTPALCIREFLQNNIYGAKAPAAELDDTAFAAEAAYHETLTNIPLENAPGFRNMRGIQQIVVSGGVATVTTTDTPVTETPVVTAHGYTVGMLATITGYEDSAGGAFNKLTVTIASVPTASTFTFATAVANGTYPPDNRGLLYDLADGNTLLNTPVGRVRASQSATMFAAHGTLDTSQQLQQSIEDLLTSCRALLVYQSGQFRLITPRAATPTSFALADDTLVGDLTLTCPGQEDAANVVVATFPNIAGNYAIDTVAWPPAGSPNDLLAADNNQFLRKEIDLPLTAQRSTAQQIATVRRRESRARMLGCVALESALALQVGDVVPVTRELYGWTAKPFRVLTITTRPDHLVELTLLEHDDTWYNLEPLDDVTYYPPSIITPYQPPTENIILTDFRKQGLVGTAGSGAMDDGFTLSYTIFSSTSAAISIPSHTLRVPISTTDYIDLTYNSGTVSVPSALDRGVPLYVYIDDPTMQGGTGGAGGYNYTTSTLVLAANAARRYVGRVTIPAGSSGSGIGLTRSLAAL